MCQTSAEERFIKFRTTTSLRSVAAEFLTHWPDRVQEAEKINCWGNGKKEGRVDWLCHFHSGIWRLQSSVSRLDPFISASRSKLPVRSESKLENTRSAHYTYEQMIPIECNAENDCWKCHLSASGHLKEGDANFSHAG